MVLPLVYGVLLLGEHQLHGWDRFQARAYKTTTLSSTISTPFFSSSSSTTPTATATAASTDTSSTSSTGDMGEDEGERRRRHHLRGLQEENDDEQEQEQDPSSTEAKEKGDGEEEEEEELEVPHGWLLFSSGFVSGLVSDNELELGLVKRSTHFV